MGRSGLSKSPKDRDQKGWYAVQNVPEEKQPKSADEDQAKGNEKVVKLTETVSVAEERKPAVKGPQAKRRLLLKLSFILMVALPGLMGTYYFGFFASDRYVSGAGFTVRGMEAGASVDMIGAFTGLASNGSTASDSYIILKYLVSRDLLEKLQADLDAKSRFMDESVDFVSRLKPAPTIEEFVEYWEGMVFTSFDSTSGVITFEVQGYTPAGAKETADLVLQYTQSLVNRLSEKARQDSVRFAESEVVKSEARLREALKDIRLFREKEQSLNPAASAQLRIELIGELESQLISIRARMAAVSGSIGANAPSMVAMRRQAEALQAQIAAKTSGISTSPGQTDSGMALSGLLAAFEALEVENGFAQQAYASALSSREQARVEADRQQRFLAVYSYPSLPEEALYPRRMLYPLMLIGLLACLWAIGALIVYSVRDHLS